MEQPNPASDRIFISCTGADAWLGERLAYDLKEREFRTFIYTEEVRPGEDYWYQKLIPEMEACTVALILLSPAALASHNCKIEHEFLIAQNIDRTKRQATPTKLIPILVDASEAFRTHYHTSRFNFIEYIPLGSDAEYNEALQLLLNALQPLVTTRDNLIANNTHQAKVTDLPRRLGRLWGVPDVPTHYLRREEDVRVVRALVLASTISAVTAIPKHNHVGVQGMGGIGKTVLTAILCNDEQVRAAFPDGIYWVTFGIKPQVELLQARLAHWIEGRPTNLSDMQSLKMLLIGLLQDKRCLLVLDDIWEVEHAHGFVGLGEGVRLLITTRKMDIANQIDAAPHPLGLLEEEDARRLLAQSSGNELTQLPTAANDILRECHGLPLALDMIGRALRRKDTDQWRGLAELLHAAELDRIKTGSTTYMYNNLWAVIDVSVKNLEPDFQAHYIDFAVFPDDIAVPKATLATYWQLSQIQTSIIVNILLDRALLLQDGDGYKLHDLQLDYVRRRAEAEQGSLRPWDPLESTCRHASLSIL